MLKKQYYQLILIILCTTFFLSSCTQTNLTWRSGKLVAQLYRQYKQEILLAYDDFHTEEIVDVQHGYARAYFDNYRKQMIFATQWSLDYLIGEHKISNETAEISGYVSDVLISDNYQIGVEILDVKIDDLEKGNFHGTKSRVIDLTTQKNVVVDGLLFNTCLLVGNYVYGLLIDDDERQFLDIINVVTMEHTRIKTADHEITFLYQQGDKVFAQANEQEKTFLITEEGLFEEKKPLYHQYPIIDGGSGVTVLKNIAPLDSSEHWYLNPLKEYDVVTQAEVLRFSENRVERTLIDFERDDIVQIMDVANYGAENVALFLAAGDVNGDLHAIISIFDLQGNEVETIEITYLLDGDVGRFTYLDYVV